MNQNIAPLARALVKQIDLYAERRLQDEARIYTGVPDETGRGDSGTESGRNQAGARSALRWRVRGLVFLVRVPPRQLAGRYLVKTL